MASKPGNKLTPKVLEENVLARLAADVDYGPEMQRLRYEQNKMAYPNAPGPMDEDLNFKDHIAGIMAKLNRPMPAPAGSNYYYTQPQYEQAMQQAYPVDPIRQQIELDERMRRAQAARAIPGSAAILSPRGFIPGMQDSTFAGGRDYASPQGPPASSNAIRDIIYQYMFPR